MSSLMWYIYDFARKAWTDAFANAKTEHEIVEKPERFRDFPKVNKEYCIGCGACTVSCPSPNAIKIVREKDTEDGEGLTYPVINPGACIRCGFCAEVCPTDPKTLECGLNHLILPEFNIIPSKRQYIVDDYLCIKCKKCGTSIYVEYNVYADHIDLDYRGKRGMFDGFYTRQIIANIYNKMHEILGDGKYDDYSAAKTIDNIYREVEKMI